MRVRTSGDVGELADVRWQRCAQIVNARRERFTVIAVFDARVLNDFRHSLAVEPDGGHAKNGVVVEGRELRPSGADQLVQQNIHVYSSLLHNLSGNFAHFEMLLLKFLSTVTAKTTHENFVPTK